MFEWWRPAASLTRAVSRIPPVGAAMRRGYLATAGLAARVFGEIREVDGVYLSGSLTRPEHVRPGHSDIDLVVIVNTPTLESELSLRRKLRLAHSTMNAVLPVFSNLDYLESRDLPMLRHFGDAWSLDLDRRWKPLVGNDRLVRGELNRAAAERSLMQLVRCVKRWMKGTSSLFLKARADALGPERILRDVLAGWTDTERLSALNDVLKRVLPTELPALESIRSGARRSGELYLAASLEVLNRWATERTAAWHGAWPVIGAPARDAPSADARAAAARLLSAGFVSTTLLSRGGFAGGAMLVAVAPDEPALATIERAQRVQRGGLPRSGDFGWAWYPIVLTPALWRAAGLLAPEPLVGGAAACPGAWSEGQPLASPAAPTREDLDALARARIVRLMLRRLVRTHRPADVWRREKLFDELCQRPVLARYERDGVLDYTSDTTRIDGDAEQYVPAARTWLAERREELSGPLAERLRRR